MSFYELFLLHFCSVPLLIGLLKVDLIVYCNYYVVCVGRFDDGVFVYRDSTFCGYFYDDDIVTAVSVEVHFLIDLE